MKITLAIGKINLQKSYKVKGEKIKYEKKVNKNTRQNQDVKHSSNADYRRE